MRSMLANLRHLRLLIGKERRWRWVLLFVFALVVASMEAVGALLVFVLLGLVAAPESGVILPIVGDVARLLPVGISVRDTQLIVAGVVAGFFLLRSVVVVSRTYVQSRLTNNAGALIAGRMLRGYLSLPYLYHTRRSSAELVRNTFTATQHLVNQALRPMLDVAAEVVVMLGLMTVLLVTSPLATLLAVSVLLPAVLLLQWVIQPRLRRYGRNSQDASTLGIASVQQAYGGIRDIKLLGQEDAFAADHQRQRLRLSRAQFRYQTVNELPRALIETALVLTIVVVFMAAVLAATALEEVLSTLGLFAYAGLRLQPSLQRIVTGLNSLRFSTAILEDLAGDQQLMQQWEHDVAAQDSPEAVSSPPPGPRGENAAPFAHQLEARSVSFGYLDGAPPVLQDVDVTIERGEFVGICGPTGGGKSTLIDLLIGLLEPTSGTISVDGRPLGLEPRWWWAQLGVVSQQVFLTDDTLRANIAFGEPAGLIDTDRMERCIRQAQLSTVIADLPNGLDTIVGERGIRLSGGQRQRVAIARALYREPPVLVFDEGTSALDAATEAALVTAIDEVKDGRTLLAVAHRISTVRDADRILVVSGGRIVEQGCYDDLLARSELFRSLAR